MTKTVTEKLTRTNALGVNMDPFGNTWGITLAPGGYALYRIGKVVPGEMTEVEGDDPKPKVDLNVKLPDTTLEGMFTTPDKAGAALKAYLTKVWDMSDRKEMQSARKEAVA